MPQSSRRLRERRNGLCGCLKVFFLHVRPRTYGHARAKDRPVWLLFLARGLKVFLFYFFARTATHVRARESEGTACVVVVSGMRFESFFFFGTHVQARTSIYKKLKKSSSPKQLNRSRRNFISMIAYLSVPHQ